jgi:hypothetical protein
MRPLDKYRVLSGSVEPESALVECAVDRIYDLAGAHVHEQQIRPIAHPLVAGRRRRQTERSPIGIVIIRNQEERREDCADDPTPVTPATRIEERRDVDALDVAPAIAELVIPRADTRSASELRANNRAASELRARTWSASARRQWCAWRNNRPGAAGPFTTVLVAVLLGRRQCRYERNHHCKKQPARHDGTSRKSPPAQ